MYWNVHARRRAPLEWESLMLNNIYAFHTLPQNERDGVRLAPKNSHTLSSSLPPSFSRFPSTLQRSAHDIRLLNESTKFRSVTALWRGNRWQSRRFFTQLHGMSETLFKYAHLHRTINKWAFFPAAFQLWMVCFWLHSTWEPKWVSLFHLKSQINEHNVKEQNSCNTFGLPTLKRFWSILQSKSECEHWCKLRSSMSGELGFSLPLFGVGNVWREKPELLMFCYVMFKLIWQFSDQSVCVNSRACLFREPVAKRMAQSAGMTANSLVH